jgi:hypothetical protein
MRTNLGKFTLLAAIALTAACGSKDKGGNAAANATANVSAGNEAVPVNQAEAAAARLQQKVKDFNDQNGGCPECQPTEARVVAQMDVPNGLRTYSATPSCMNEARDTGEIRKVSDDAAALSDGNFAGAAAELLRSQAVKQMLARNAHGDVGRILNGGDDRTAYCQAVCAVLPVNSTVTGYKLEAANADDQQFQTCQAGSDCSIRRAKWTAEPIPTSGENSKTVCGVFANWDHNDHRLARLSVYFTPPDDWVPPHR